jgi:hypothetical protein
LMSVFSIRERSVVADLEADHRPRGVLQRAAGGAGSKATCGGVLDGEQEQPGGESGGFDEQSSKEASLMRTESRKHQSSLGLRYG